MNPRESPIYWSFPCGVWWQTQVRISIYFPLVVLLFCYRLENLQLGLIFSGLLFLSVLLHEFGHVIAARATGGSGDSILIWPLGGLAFVQPAPTLRSQLLSSAGGPLVNAALCLVLLPAVLSSAGESSLFNPLTFPLAELSDRRFSDICVLGFYANWILLLISLVPVYPLDGGRIVRTLLTTWFPREAASRAYTRIGFGVAFIGMFIGLMIDSSLLVFIGSILLLLNLQESMQMQVSDGFDDSFMGYDFSQGYTSLERADGTSVERRPGPIARWRERRRQERELRLRERDAEDERQLDLLLNRVHQVGMNGLSDAERRQLNRVSTRLRSRNRDSSSS